MKIILLLLLLVPASADELDPDSWTNSQDQDQVNWLESEQDMMLRGDRGTDPRGLMEKRSSAKSQITRRRQKFQTFVGLMGRRDAFDPVGHCRRHTSDNNR